MRVEDEPELTLLERTKIQAEVLIPLVRAMEDEIGREQAHRLVRQALGDQVRKSIRASTPSRASGATVEWLLRFSQAGDALDLDRLDGAPDEFNVNVTRCAYAEFFDQLDLPVQR